MLKKMAEVAAERRLTFGIKTDMKMIKNTPSNDSNVYKNKKIYI